MRRLIPALSAVKRCPSSSISPEVASSRPVMQPMVVLLPEPLGPRKPNMVPAGTASERFSTASSWPYFFTRLVVRMASRSEEHTSELQSLRHLVCRLLLEKNKQYKTLY